MTVPLSLLTTALLLSMAETGAAGAAAPEFSTTSQMVLVPVTVTDRNARNATRITRAGRFHHSR